MHDPIVEAWKESQRLEQERKAKKLESLLDEIADFALDVECRHKTAHVLDYTLAQALKSYRIERGLALRPFAAELGITGQYLSDLEKGRRHFSDKMLERVKALGGTVRRAVASSS